MTDRSDLRDTTATLILSAPVISRALGKARVSCQIIDGERTRELWFEVDDIYAGYLPTRSLDAFVVAALLPAMRQGKNITALGPMSSMLNYNINHLLGTVLREFLPSSRKIRVTAERLLSSRADRAAGVLSGFSAGVDSFCNYFDHSGDRVAPEFRLTHFVYNNVGSHGQHGGERDKAIFDARAATVGVFTAREGKPLIRVDSNLDDIIGMNFQLTHTLRNAAVALLFQDLVSKFLYPSGCHARDIAVEPSNGMAELDAVILPLLSTERLDCISSGGEYERTEKTAIVASMPASWDFLDVCVEPLRAKPGMANCSVCWKCMRTQLTFDILGKLDLYDKVFDIATYRRCRNMFLVDVLKSPDIFQKDLAALIKARHQPIPLRVRLAVLVTPRFIARRIGRYLIPRVARHPSWLKLFNVALG